MLGSPSLEEFTGIVTGAEALLRSGRGVREADRGSCAWGEVNMKQSESPDTVGGRRVTLMLLGGRRRIVGGRSRDCGLPMGILAHQRCAPE